jgi:hypothetical protein
MYVNWRLNAAIGLIYGARSSKGNGSISGALLEVSPSFAAKEKRNKSQGLCATRTYRKLQAPTMTAVSTPYGYRKYPSTLIPDAIP